jgi:hypothetical protein
MQRYTAVFWTCAWIILFFTMAYYGIGVTVWSSIVFAFFVGIVLLNFCYPISKVASEPADVSLYLYATLILVGFALFVIYIVQRTLTDVRV